MSTITVRSGGRESEILCTSGATLLDVLCSESFDLAAPCGGTGKCGKCAVTLLAPDGTRERVLACRTPAEAAAGRTVLVPDAAAGGVIELAGSGGASGALSGLAAAVDIGTTTLAVRIIDRATGETLAAAGDWSAQAPYGADVISRIKASSSRAAREALRPRAKTGCRAHRVRLPRRRRRAGRNRRYTLRRQYDDGAPLRRALARGHRPRADTPATLFTDGAAGRLDAFPGAPLRVAPCVSGYVGGDTVAAVYASGLAEDGGTRLLMDIGTNGELVLSRGGRLMCCSVACGPAFEGAEIGCGMRSAPGAISAVHFSQGEFWYVVIGGGAPVGICGTGIIDLLAELLKSGVVDGSGRLLEPDELPEGLRSTVSVNRKGNVSFTLAPGVRLTAGEIRNCSSPRPPCARAWRSCSAAPG